MLQSIGVTKSWTRHKTEQLNSAELSVDPLCSQFDLQEIFYHILRDLIDLLPNQ